MTRRTAARITMDRSELCEAFPTDRFMAAPSWAKPNDLAALVAAGRLERKVKREWDRQTGYAANLFGGAGVMQRRRAYYRRVVTTVTVDQGTESGTLAP